jgi:hypothetical protein
MHGIAMRAVRSIVHERRDCDGSSNAHREVATIAAVCDCRARSDNLLIRVHHYPRADRPFTAAAAFLSPLPHPARGVA